MFLVKNKSGKRDSNSRPQPWQGCALPTELFPQHNSFLFQEIISNIK